MASKSIHDVKLREESNKYHSDFSNINQFIFREDRAASDSFIPQLHLDADIFPRYSWTKPKYIGNGVFAKRVDIYIRGEIPEWLFKFAIAFLWESGEQTSLGIYIEDEREKLRWEGQELAKAKDCCTNEELLHLIQTTQVNDYRIGQNCGWSTYGGCVLHDAVRLFKALDVQFLFLVLQVQANPNFIHIRGEISSPPAAHTVGGSGSGRVSDNNKLERPTKKHHKC